MTFAADSAAYVPPAGAQLFVLERVLDWERLFALPTFAHADTPLARTVLEEGARFCAQVLGPLNARGDEQGSRLVDGRVRTPEGFADAFRRFAEDGWTGLDLPHEFGGQALPLTVQVAFAEMVNGACVSFGMLPIMLRAAAWLLIEHGSDDLVKRLVPRLAAGTCAATICITEAHAGSDVGRIRTHAAPIGDGRYVLHGSKIFITYADHDFTEQIVHLVLARTPQAPAGTRGLSLFVVPKLDIDDGSVNGVSIGRVERKMGLKASPTCVLELDGALGFRVGEEGQGLGCMFTMVNLMRLEVAIQGVSQAAVATRKALDHAAGRLQGGAPGAPAVPIIEHADVRRMLHIMRARTEAMRALVFEAAFDLDLARWATDDQERAEARHLAEFLLPVCKTCAAETGFEVASLAVQVLGGHGYMAEAGVEQHLRDSRVMAIYEGTSGIQALDLVTRKLMRDDAIRYRIFVRRVRETLTRCQDDSGLDAICGALADALAALEQCSDALLACRDSRQRDLQAAATDYLQLVGLVASAWMWLRMAAATDENADAQRAHRALAGFFAAHLLPEAGVRRQRILAGATPLDALDSGGLASGC